MKVHFPGEFRENVRQKLQGILHSIRPSDDQNDHLSLVDAAKNIEIGVFNFAVQKCKEEKLVRHWNNPMFVLVYTDRLRTVLVNLRKSTFLQSFLFSPDFDETHEAILSVNNSVNNIAIRAQNVSSMTHQQLNPPLWTSLISAKEKRNENKFESKAKKATTTTFTCKNPQCKSTDCSYSAQQTRSGDEAMTIFITCNVCGKTSKTS